MLRKPHGLSAVSRKYLDFIVVNLVLVCVLLSLGRQIPQKHSCFLGDKGLFCDQLIRAVGKVSLVLFERLCPDASARLGLEGFQTLHGGCGLQTWNETVLWC